MSAGIVESIKFTRTPGACDWPGHHDRWDIYCADQNAHVYWCDHPCCDAGATRWRLSTSPPEVMLTLWVPTVPTVVAVAYLLLVFPLDALPRIEARIGICDQWRDRQAGNVALPGEDHKLFTDRYFAEAGPGVYPAPIEVVQ